MTTNANYSGFFSTNYSANERAVVLYDVPFFATPAFCAAADAFNFWAGQHTIAVNEAEAASDECAPGPVTRAATLSADLRVYRLDSDVAFKECLAATSLLQEVLGHIVQEVHELHAQYRGHYLAQLSSRWYCDGTLNPFRFRVAHMLSTYFAVMPDIGSTTGVLPDCPYDVTLVGWSNVHGDFVDAVSLFRDADEFLDGDVSDALVKAKEQYPATFAGLRYLPLEDMDEARFYLPDGTWEPVRERGTLGSP